MAQEGGGAMKLITIIQWLKIQRQNRKDFPEVGNDKKIESLDTAISYLDDLQEIKKVVAKWKAGDFIGSDGFAWDCMKEIADIVDEVEE